MFIAYFVAGPLQNNCYLLAPDGGDRGIVIDAPLGASETVERALAEHGLGLAGVLLTHGHIDHCAEAARLADAHDAPVLVSAADRVLLTRPELALSPELAAQLVALLPGPPAEPRRVELYDPSRPLSIGGLRLTVLPAPGHTPGSVLLRTSTGDDEVAFTGDVLFAGSIGRTDLPAGDDPAMRASLRDVVRELPARVQVLPGHGPFSTMADELAANPYLTDAYVEALS